jgi:pilus assembly protein FimV
MKTPMLRSSLVAAMMLAFSGGAGAAGLGRINVLSALGQPLRAEVEISASAEEIETMTAKVASPDAFQRANIEYSGSFSAVRMTVERRADKGAVLKITSHKPFSEPFVDMLLELNWAGGRLLREYTFLLDPTPEHPEGQKAVVPVEEPVVKPLESVATKSSGSTKRAKEPVLVEKSEPREPRDPGDGYTVKRGDTLNKVAAEVKPVEVSQEQMLAALYKANSDAFVGGNINRLRAGKVLRVPDAEETRQLAPREARKVVLKAASFDAYREKVGKSAAEKPAKDDATGQSSSGKVEPKVVENNSGQSAQKNTVTVTATQAGKAGGKASAASDDAGSKTQLKALQDELATRNKAVEEANSRAEDLKKQIEELKKLVELKSQLAAEAQRKADEALRLAKADAKNVKKAEEKPAVVQSQPAEELKTPPVVEASPIVAEVSAPVVETAAVSEPVVEVSPPKAVPAAQPDEVFRPEGQDEGTNPWPLLGLGLVALGGGYFWMKQRKRKKANEGLSQLSEVSTTSPNSVFGNAVGQTIDTGGTSLLHTDFSQSGMSAIDADEGVDPVAEADVYMAYGRDAQAEEILLDALKTDPGRNAIYLKLLEIYAARRSVKQFENIAADLHVRTGGSGDDWAKAVALGQQIDPSNPLFGASKAVPAAVAPVVAEVPVVDLSVSSLSAAVAAAEAPIDEAPVSFGTNNVSQMRSTWTVPGDINQLSTTTGAGDMPIVVDLPQDIGTSSVSDSLNLDFNLDLDSPEVEDLPTRIEPREELAAAPVQPVLSEPEVDIAQETPLEFDIGLDDELEPPVAAPAPAPKPAPSQPKYVEPVVAVEDQSDADVGIESANQGALAEVDLEKTNFEGSLLDFDFELSDDSQKPALDLSSVNLHAPSAAVSKTTSVAPPAMAELGDLPDIGDSIDVNDEVTTKLELARAYEEMGDVEGARELLEEVVSDGSAVQKDEARAMMQRLGA